MTSLFAQDCKICGDKFTYIRGLNIHSNVHKDLAAGSEKIPSDAANKSTSTNVPDKAKAGKN